MTGSKRDDATAEALRAISAVGADAAARGEDPGPLWEVAAAAAARAYAEKRAADAAMRRMLRSAKAAQAKRGEP